MICSSCGNDTGNVHYYCRECNRKQMRERRARDPEAQKAKQRAYYARQRERILARLKEWRERKKDENQESYTVPLDPDLSEEIAQTTAD
jgi:predicted amidophosphoribosyltransferase